MDGENVSLAIAFAAGILSFASPCVLPLVPVYITHLAGSSVGAGGSPTRLTGFLHALSFVLGFSVIFILLGASVGLVGSLVSEHMSLLRKVAGGVLIVLGLHMSGLVSIPFLYRERRAAYNGRAPAYVRSFLIGSAFSIGWTPCVGPVLGAILALAWSSHTVLKGTYLLGSYSLGLGVPFLAAGLAVGTVSHYLSRLNRYLRAVELVSAALLIVIGVLIFTDDLTRLNEYFDFGFKEGV